MSVSSEFAKMVQENNVLRIRIMLKDSLLVDKSFSMFSELLTYALANGVEVWMNPEGVLEQAEKPWTRDLMNYELTALVNDFTHEHVTYIKQIISEIYKDDAAINTQTRRASSASVTSLKQESSQKSTYSREMKDLSRTSVECYETILQESGSIEKILKNNKDANGNRRWLRADIEKIKRSARNIEAACESVQRRDNYGNNS